MTRRVRLVGIGCGHPDQLTIEAVEALRTAAFALVTVKRDDDPLAAARHAIIERHAPGLRVIEVLDPERDRSSSSTATKAGYEGVVTEWHDARAEAWELALATGWEQGPGDVALLVWGDPAFYDSTIRVVERVLARGELSFEWDVLPGISALQLLAARHRIVLHEVGQPILVTTARRLRAAIVDGAENVVVMLGASLDLDGLDDWHIWWGANLGTSDERLVAGRVADVLPTLEAARAEAKATSGWVMDVYLLRRPRAAT
ncbi:MAG: precorrin-6A synthase (deacetylating) [Actinomycetales bacterium]|nr:MAG: precorrin-6A synthase (deacetylating) [Actinomycetales bacterium]